MHSINMLRFRQNYLENFCLFPGLDAWLAFPHESPDFLSHVAETIPVEQVSHRAT